MDAAGPLWLEHPVLPTTHIKTEDIAAATMDLVRVTDVVGAVGVEARRGKRPETTRLCALRLGLLALQTVLPSVQFADAPPIQARSQWGGGRRCAGIAFRAPRQDLENSAQFLGRLFLVRFHVHPLAQAIEGLVLLMVSSFATEATRLAVPLHTIDDDTRRGSPHGSNRRRRGGDVAHHRACCFPSEPGSAVACRVQPLVESLR